jgi:predicted SAM-dependent methyltransferase
MMDTDMIDNKKILDLGCGKNKRAGAVGVDYSDMHDADVIHDLNVFPYPFESSVFDEIYMDNALEHLDNVILVMEEIHRICKPGGLVKVSVPYFRSVWAFIDPTHRNFFTVNSFAYFDPAHSFCDRYDYSTARFIQEKRIFNESFSNNLFKRLVIWIANRWPSGYEYYLSHIYPLDELSFYLRKSI